MDIIDTIDQYIEMFVNRIRKARGWIAKDDIYRQFITMFEDFDHPLFDPKKLEDYLIKEVSWYSGIKIVEDASYMED
jgi:hypothetical protein